MVFGAEGAVFFFCVLHCDIMVDHESQLFSCSLPVGVFFRGCRGGKIEYGFETGDLMGWRIVEGRFKCPVSSLAAEHNSGRPYTKEGRWFLSTLETPKGVSDAQTGVIESPLVRLSGSKVSFRVGGGRKCSFSIVDRASGRTLASASGSNS